MSVTWSLGGFGRRVWLGWRLGGLEACRLGGNPWESVIVPLGQDVPRFLRWIQRTSMMPLMPLKIHGDEAQSSWLINVNGFSSG